jgi:isoleucyl-tRNA synthetase
VNRVQKLRKKAGLEPTDTVEVYYDVLDGVVGSDSSVLQQVFTGQASYMAEAVGGPVLQQQHLPAHAVVLAAELYKGVAGGSFKITLARPALSFAQDLLHEICSGNPAHAENLRVVLLSRDPTNLRSELSSNKKVKVVIDGQGEYELEAGKHFHFSVGDHLLQASCRS